MVNSVYKNPQFLTIVFDPKKILQSFATENNRWRENATKKIFERINKIR